MLSAKNFNVLLKNIVSAPPFFRMDERAHNVKQFRWVSLVVVFLSIIVHLVNEVKQRPPLYYHIPMTAMGAC